MTTDQMPAAKVIQAIEVMAGIPITSKQLPLITGRRPQIITAIHSDDAEGLAAHVCNAIATELKKAGFDGVISVRGLRSHITAERWDLVEDVIAQRENASARLKRKMESLHGASQFAAQGTRTDGAASPARPAQGQPPAQDRRPERAPSSPPTRDQGRPAESSSTGGQRPSQSAPAAHDSRDRQAPSRPQQHSGGSRDGDWNRGQPRSASSRPAAPEGTSRAPQRHNNDNVRTIGSARSGAAQQASGAHGDAERRVYDQKKVHGGKAAVGFEADTTRQGAPTVRVEAAKMLNPAERTYDWGKKVALQMTSTELQHVTALLYGLIDHVKYTSHGPEQDKWFEMERQSGQYAGTIKVVVGKGSGAEGIMCITQITSADLGDVVALFTRQCAAQMKLEQGSLLMALRPVADAYNSAKSRSGAGNSGQGRSGGGANSRPAGGYQDRRAG